MMDRFTTSALALLASLALIVVGLADVAGSVTVAVIVGGALVLAPLLASLAEGLWKLSRDDSTWDDDLAITFRRR